MALTVLLGGARSGKSSLAVRMAAAAGGPVVFVATAEALDDEMARRIAQHRAERPAEWSTVEEPVELASAVAAADPRAFLVVDCLTLWLSNVQGRRDDEILRAAAGAAALAAERPGTCVAITNEVGSGIVPADAATRRYRDLLGAVNATWVAGAGTAALVVAGRVLPLAPPDRLLLPPA